MTRTLYLDCFAGASGDMLLGALLDCGLDFELLRSELLKLGVEGYELSLKRVDRSGISAAKFDVHLTGETRSTEHGRQDGRGPAGEHHHEHEHKHKHEHSRESPHHEHHHHEHHHHEHRSLSEIKRVIESSNLADRAKQRAQTIFQRIGEAESKIHNIP